MKFRQIRDFIRTGIWDADLSAYSKFKARVTRHLKVFIITLRTFSNKQVGYRAVALAFFTTIALVPCIALAFAITNGFGIDDDLAQLLLLNYSAQEEIIKTVLQYADNVIGATQRGGFGIVSFLCFIWLVFWLMIQVESNFNYVWGVRVGKTRKIWKRLGAYFMIIILLAEHHDHEDHQEQGNEEISDIHVGSSVSVGEGVSRASCRDRALGPV